MTAGKLKDRVTLKNVVRVPDGSGGWTRDDSRELTVWAEVRMATAREEERSMRREQRVNRIVRIRFRSDIIREEFGPEAVATYVDKARRTRTLAIKTVLDEDGEGSWIILGCLEGGPS